MIIGVPKEIKNHEYRVGLTPAGVAEAVAAGHRVLIERSAGAAIGFSDEQYLLAGALLAESAEQVFAEANLIVKVKEPQASERKMLRPQQILFTYLHLAADSVQASELLQSRAHCIAYETVRDAQGRLPLLAPMSEVAGRLSVQAGAHCLQKAQGGRGVLLGGVPGVEAARVLILGAGVVGQNALAMAVGLGARVTIMDKQMSTLKQLDQQYQNRIQTRYSNEQSITEQLELADLVIGAVLIPGASAPKLVQKRHLDIMKEGSVLVDVAIDQGGCFETSHPTTHDKPTFTVNGIIHYCVANMPGAVARTSTLALTNVTLPYIISLANKGLKQALTDDTALAQGLNISNGHICNHEVATSLNLPYTDLAQVISAI